MYTRAGGRDDGMPQSAARMSPRRPWRFLSIRTAWTIRRRGAGEQRPFQSCAELDAAAANGSRESKASLGPALFRADERAQFPGHLAPQLVVLAALEPSQERAET